VPSIAATNQIPDRVRSQAARKPLIGHNDWGSMAQFPVEIENELLAGP
jgi:hypothetical protein